MIANFAIINLESIENKFNQWVNLVGFKHSLKPTDMFLWKYEYKAHVAGMYSSGSTVSKGLFLEFKSKSYFDEVKIDNKTQLIEVMNCLN